MNLANYTKPPPIETTVTGSPVPSFETALTGNDLASVGLGLVVLVVLGLALRVWANRRP
jgi:hypothetical protein